MPGDEQGQLLEALRESQKKYQALMDESSDAIFIVDTEGNLLEVNKKAEELTGYSKEDLLNSHFTRLHPDEVIGDVGAVFRRGLQEGTSSYVELPLKRKDGRTIYVDLVGKFIECSGKKLGQAIVRNITDRKEAEEIVGAYLGGPSRGKSDVPQGARVLGAYSGNDGVLYIDISDEFRKNFQGDAMAEYLLLKGLYESIISNVSGINDVKVLIEGKEIESIGGHLFAMYPLKDMLAEIK